MKKYKEQMLTSLNVSEMKSVMGGFAPPTDEQKKEMRKQYGLLADIICW